MSKRDVLDEVDAPKSLLKSDEEAGGVQGGGSVDTPTPVSQTPDYSPPSGDGGHGETVETRGAPEALGTSTTSTDEDPWSKDHPLSASSRLYTEDEFKQGSRESSIKNLSPMGQIFLRSGLSNPIQGKLFGLDSVEGVDEFIDLDKTQEGMDAFDYVADTLFTGPTHGIASGIENTLNAVLDPVYGEKTDSMGMPVKRINLTKNMDMPKSVTGHLSRGMSNFLIGFIPIRKAVVAGQGSVAFLNFLKNKPTLNTFFTGIVAGGITDYAVWNPVEGNLATITKDTWFDPLVPDIFEHDEDDSQWEKRLKTAGEGAYIGASLEWAFVGLRTWRRGVKNKSARKSLGIEGSIDEAADVATRNLSNARIVFKQVEDIVTVIRKHWETKPGLKKAIQHLESEERVGRAAAPKATPVAKDAETLNVWHGSGENAGLSNLTPRSFRYQGREYKSVEHAFQSNKGGVFDEAVYANKAWDSPGRRVRGKAPKNTNKVRSQIMRRIIKDMLFQNPEAAEELARTVGKRITHTQDKGFWGREFPKILHSLRDDLEMGNEAYDLLDDEVKALVDSSEVLRGQLGVKSRKQALEQHYNANALDEADMPEAIRELEGQGEQGAELAGRIKAIMGENVDNILEQAGRHLDDMEVEFLRFADERGAPYKALGGYHVAALVDQVNAAYPQGYTNKITAKYSDRSEQLLEKRRIDYADPLYDGEKPSSIKNLASVLDSDEMVQFIRVLQTGNMNTVRIWLQNLQRDGKPSGFDTLLRNYEDLGAHELMDTFQSMLKLSDSDLFRTRTLKSIGIEATALATKTIKQMMRDFETAGKESGMGQRAVDNILNAYKHDPQMAYHRLAEKTVALRLVQQFTTRHLGELAADPLRSKAATLKAWMLADELAAIYRGSISTTREIGRGLRAQGIPVSDVYEDLMNRGFNLDGAVEQLNMASELGAGGGAEALKQQRLFLERRGKTLGQVRRRNWREAMVQFWLGSILSALPTLTINNVSNAMGTALFQGESIFGSVLPRLKGIKNVDEFKRELADIPRRVGIELKGAQAIGTGLKMAFRVTGKAREGLWQALREGRLSAYARDASRPENGDLGYFWSGLITGEAQMDMATKFDLGGSESALTMGKLFPDTSRYSTFGRVASATLGTLNLVPGTTFRILMAGDSAAKAVNYAIKRATAARKLAHSKLERARTMGLDNPKLSKDKGRFSAEDANDFVQEIEANSMMWDHPDFLESPIREDLRTIHEEATRYSQYATWTEPQEYGKVARTIANATHVTPELKFVMPFINTPLNLLKSTLERTPMANKLLGNYKRVMESGTEEEKYALKTRLRAGSMIWAGAGVLAFQGRITGGAPRDSGERDRWLERKIPEYSLWVKTPYEDIPEGSKKWAARDPEDEGAAYITYGRLEPYASIFKMAADLHYQIDNWEDADIADLFNSLVTVTSNNLLSQSYFEGLSRLFTLAWEPERTDIVEQLEVLGGSFIPNILMVGRRTYSDPYMREANGLFEQILNRTPWSPRLLARTDFFNRSREYPQAWGGFINPIYTGTWERDPVAEALTAAEMDLDQKRAFGRVHNVDLTPEHAAKYKELTNTVIDPATGLNLYDRLHQIVTEEPLSTAFDAMGPDWKGIRGGKHEIMKKVIDQYKSQAADFMLDNNQVPFNEGLAHRTIAGAELKALMMTNEWSKPKNRTQVEALKSLINQYDHEAE